MTKMTQTYYSYIYNFTKNMNETINQTKKQCGIPGSKNVGPVKKFQVFFKLYSCCIISQWRLNISGRFVDDFKNLLYRSSETPRCASCLKRSSKFLKSSTKLPRHVQTLQQMGLRAFSGIFGQFLFILLATRQFIPLSHSPAIHKTKRAHETPLLVHLRP